MLKYKAKGPSNTVFYGFSASTGMFLSVIDSGLLHDEEADDDVNQEIAQLGITNKTGSYLDLRTGDQGPGLKVTEKTMLVFLKRYGVTDDQIQALIDATRNNEPQHKCQVCQTPTNKSCPVCKSVYYCNFDCQVSDWDRLHQSFCKLLPLLPPPKDTFKRVRGVLLPENSALPQIVYIPIDYSFCESRFIEIAMMDEWIKAPVRSLAMLDNPLRENALFENTLQFSFHDESNNNNDSDNLHVANQSVAKLTKGRHKHDWWGPVLVCKRRGLYDKDTVEIPFIDIQMEDFSDIRDFFLAYETDAFSGSTGSPK